MFESSPQSKIAIAYLLNKPDGDQVSLVVIYSVSTNRMLRILRCESDVTQMCTPGDDSLFIVGTILGSLYLYDINEFESSQERLEDLDFEALLKTLHPIESEHKESDEYQERLQ